jgi:ZIP family zinc transporter/zinc and cadmium transporter
MFVFAGFLALYVLQHIMMFHAGHDETHNASDIGTVSAIGLTFHSLLDGIVIAIGFEASPALGIMTTLAVLLHKLPEGVTVSGILLHTHADKKKILTFAFVIAAATPVGAVLARIFLMHVTKGVLGALLAFTAGSFIYLAASDLLPETHRAYRQLNAVFFFLGIALIAVVTKLL